MVTSCGNKKQLSRNAHQPLHAPCGGGGGDAGLSSPWLRQPPTFQANRRGEGARRRETRKPGFAPRSLGARSDVA